MQEALSEARAEEAAGGAEQQIARQAAAEEFEPNPHRAAGAARFGRENGREHGHAGKAAEQPRGQARQQRLEQESGEAAHRPALPPVSPARRCA